MLAPVPLLSSASKITNLDITSPRQNMPSSRFFLSHRRVLGLTSTTSVSCIVVLCSAVQCHGPVVSCDDMSCAQSASDPLGRQAAEPVRQRRHSTRPGPTVPAQATHGGDSSRCSTLHAVQYTVAPFCRPKHIPPHRRFVPWPRRQPSCAIARAPIQAGWARPVWGNWMQQLKIEL